MKTKAYYLSLLLAIVYPATSPHTSCLLYKSDKTEITKIRVYTVLRPTSIEELSNIVRNADRPLSVGGSFYSQGGQTAYPGGIVIDMAHFDAITNLDATKKLITVQAGAPWKKVQELIDPHNLSVKVMQSYNDFSIGGSLAVNVHARDMHYGSLIDSVESFRMMLHNGSIITVDRRSDLFYGAIGGYGLLGIIIDATFTLTENVKLERVSTSISAAEYPQLFKKLKQDRAVVFQNADMYPPQLTQAQSITWRTTRKALTKQKRLQSFTLGHIPQRAIEKAMQKVPKTRKLRPQLDFMKSIGCPVVWRNYEMSYSVDQLAIQSHFPTTMTLQEYFVPLEKYGEALKLLRDIFKIYAVNVLNVSVRYVPKDTASILSYAPQDSFAFVLYICIQNSDQGKKELVEWTRIVTEKIVRLGGTFYLPYIIAGRKDQFNQAYKRHEEFAHLKAKYDPKGVFKNMLWKSYFE